MTGRGDERSTDHRDRRATRLAISMTDERSFLDGRVLVVAFEGWNDAGEAASGAVRTLKGGLDLVPLKSVDPELYFDYQFNRPVTSTDEDGRRLVTWPEATIFGPASLVIDHEDGTVPGESAVEGTNAGTIHLLLGVEPSRSWKSFTAELIDTALAADVSGIVLLGAMLADVPHTRPISVFTSSDNPAVRAALEIERSSYEGPVGILSVFAQAAEEAGIPTMSVWASVPHYVHNAASPKAILALVERLEELLGVTIPRGDLVEEATAWEGGIDAIAADDDDMAAYIEQLEQARDTVESPEASGEAIAQEFERYLRRRDGRSDGPGEPWRKDG